MWEPLRQRFSSNSSFINPWVWVSFNFREALHPAWGRKQLIMTGQLFKETSFCKQIQYIYIWGSKNQQYEHDEWDMASAHHEVWFTLGIWNTHIMFLFPVLRIKILQTLQNYRRDTCCLVKRTVLIGLLGDSEKHKSPSS